MMAQPGPAYQDNNSDDEQSSANDAVEQTVKKPSYHNEKNLVNYRLYKTICLYVAFVALGFCSSVLGPSLVDMQRLFGVDTKTISAALTGSGLGYLFGSLLCGLLYNRLNQELGFLTGTGLMAIVTAAMPWSPNVYAFIAANFVQKMGMGFLDAGGQAYIVYLWKGTKRLDPLMQAVHMIWAVGSTIGPLIVKPFLMPAAPFLNGTETNNTEQNLTTNFFPTVGYNDTYHNYSIINKGSTQFSLKTKYRIKDLGFRIHYAYLTIGCLTIISTAIFAVAFLIDNPSVFRKKDPPPRGKETKKECKKDRRTLRIVMLVILFFWYCIYAWIEDLLGSFIALFVVKEFGWSTAQGAGITSVLWGSLGVGRLLGVPIAAFFSPLTMIYSDMILTAVAFGLMLVSIYTTTVLMYIGVSMAGFFMATTFASGILWTQRYTAIDGVAGSIFLVGSSVGSMTGPPLAGYLIQTYTPRSLIYLTLSATIAHIVVFLILHITVRTLSRNLPSPSAEENYIYAIKEMEALNTKLSNKNNK